MRTAGAGRRLKPVAPEVVLAMFDQRLVAVADVLIDHDQAANPDSPGSASVALLPQLLDACRATPNKDIPWLVLTAAFGAFPTSQQLLEFVRMLELSSVARAESTLLAEIIDTPLLGRLDLPLRVVSGGVVVDVNSTARTDGHTGIQRTVRETLPRWKAKHELSAVAWVDPWCAFRNLRPVEVRRVFEHPDTTLSHEARSSGPRNEAAENSEYRLELVVPWRSSVVLPDSFSLQAKEQFTAMARFSGNTVSMIGYDLIPLTSAETRILGEANYTAAYLSMVKYAHRVAGISRSAVSEFAGFSSSLRAQGLAGPEVREIRLTNEPLRGDEVTPAALKRHTRPVMLCLGTQEPHKNQRAALHAAERLWREGLDFEVHLVGGRGWTDAVLKPAIDALLKAGRPIQNLGRVSDARLLAEMRGADFAYFASLHEGYGLPVVEALATGTPVITSNFGSQAEIGELGGCLLIDPRDDDDVAAGIRTLLTDKETLSRLRAEAVALQPRTWDEYAAELWEFVAPTEELA